MTVPGLISAQEVEGIISGSKPWVPPVPEQLMEAEPVVQERSFLEGSSVSLKASSAYTTSFQDGYSYGVLPMVAPVTKLADEVLRRAGTVTEERGRELQRERVQEAQDEVTARERDAENRRAFIEATTRRAGGDMAALEQRFGREAVQQGTAPAKKRLEDAKATAPTQEWWLSSLDEFRKAVGSTAIATLESPAVLYDLVQESLTGEAEQNDVRKFFESYQNEVLFKTYPGDKARAKDFLTTLSQGAGSMTAFLAGGAATRALGMSAKVGAGTVGAASQSTMQVRDAEDFGATTVQKWLAYMGGAGVGATEMLPIDRMFRRLDQATGGGVAETLKRTAANSLEEFVQELGQGIGEDVVAKHLAFYDPDREMDLAGYLKQATAGAIIGGGSALLTEGMSGRERAEAIETTRQATQTVQGAPIEQGEADQAETSEQRSTAFSEAQARLNEITGTDEEVALPTTPAGDTGPADATVTEGETAAQQPGEDAEAVAETGIQGEIDQMAVEQAARATTETPEFKNWFKDSKVVDEQGQPLVVYHGTNADFKAFDPDRIGEKFGADRAGFFFTNNTSRDMASGYAETGDGFGGNVMPVYLSMQNPWTLRNYAWEVGWTEQQLAQMTDEQVANEILDGMPVVQWFDKYKSDFVDTVIEQGYDGILLKDPTFPVRGGQPEILAAAFEPTQIKSIFNRGTFDPNDPNIDAMAVKSLDDVLDDIKGSGIDVFASESRGIITLSKIVVPESQRNEGVGTQAMQSLIDYADRTGQVIGLSPSADFGGSKSRLIDFYKRFGFFENKGKNKNFSTSESMVREPAVEAMAVNRAQGPLRAEPMRAVQGVADRGQQSEDVALSAMKNSLTKLLDLTVRQGRLMAGKGALGQYSGKTGVIRMRTWGDYSVLVHEAGHALNDDRGAALDKVIQTHTAEVRQVAAALYPADTSKMPVRSQNREGFAEFFRVYMMNKAAAQQLAPNFYLAFEQTLQVNSPELFEGLQLIRQQFDSWLQIPSTKLVQSFIVSGRKPSMMDEAKAGVQEDGLLGWMKRGFSALGYKSYLQGIDQMHAIRKAVFELSNTAEENLGKPFGLEASDNPHILAVLGANSQNAAMVQLKNGVREYGSSNVVAPALRDAIVTAMGQDPTQNGSRFDEQRLADFNAYLVARRARHEYQRFREGELLKPPVAFSEGDALQAIADFEGRYGAAFLEAADKVYQFNRAMMQRAYDAGMVSDETFDLAMQKEDYVPLMRDMSDKAGQYGETVLTTGKASIVKQFRGSDRDIIAPLDAIMNRAFALEKTMASNETRKALARLADRAGKGGGRLVERIPSSQVKAMTVPVEETMKKVLDSPELDPVDAAEIAAVFEAAFDDQKSINLFRRETISDTGEQVVFFWEDGERKALQIGDVDVAGDLYNALAVIGNENMPLLSDILTLPASMIRTGVTAWPDFQVVNYIRDQVSAYFLSGTNFIPFVSGTKGIMSELRNKKVAQDYNAAMGLMGGMNVASVDIARGQRDIEALRKKGYKGEIAGDGTITGAIKGLGRFVELTETGTRLGIFEAAYNRATGEGLAEQDALTEAAFMAVDYMNYGSRGSRMLLATRAVPFLNASLRGLDKLTRTAFGGEAAGRRGVKFALTSYFKNINNLQISRREKMALKTGRALWAKMAGLAVISAALAKAFEDDEDYQEASTYLRATGWVIPYGDGKFVWIPKPFELAIIANFTERAIEFANGDDRAMSRFMEGVGMTAVPPFQSPTIKLAYELSNNVNTFRGGSLVPDYMLRLPPELQYHARTSELAKRMGEVVGVSPIKIEHSITSLFASAGRDLLPMLDKPLNPNRADKGIDETMVTRRFWRSVDRGSVSSQDFYKMMSRKNGDLTQAAAGYSKKMETGNEAEANAYLSYLTENEQAWALLNHHFSAKYKRMHPGYRANQVASAVSAMRREIVSSFLADTSGTGDSIPLTGKQRQLVDDVLADIQRREMRNAMVSLKAPGWADKLVMDTRASSALLEATNPFVAEELERRLSKAKVYDANMVHENWPDLKRRLTGDRGEAILDDLLALHN